MLQNSNCCTSLISVFFFFNFSFLVWEVVEVICFLFLKIFCFFFFFSFFSFFFFSFFIGNIALPKAVERGFSFLHRDSSS